MLKILDDREIISIYKTLSEELKIEWKHECPPPRPFCLNPEGVKAIVLGTDPSTKDGKRFDYVFDLNPLNPGDHRYFKNIEDNLNAIGLNIGDIYVQNVCQNYFLKETKEQETIWKQAADIWTPNLKKELDGNFHQNIPVIVTAEIILEVLLERDQTPHEPDDIYKCRCEIPYLEKINKLNRTLIPLYRHHRYSLKNIEWNEYRKVLIDYFKA
jgi:hypothetical protein